MVLYKNPHSVKEAISWLDEGVVIAGGTDLGVKMSDPLYRPDSLVDITGIRELSEIKTDMEGIILGACVTVDELSAREDLPDCIRMGASAIGSPQIRNIATIGGNICNASPCGDTLTPLVVLDALFVLESPEGTREMTATDFFKGPKMTALKKNEILTFIKLPKERLSGRSGFRMIGKRNGQAISQVNAAVWTFIEDGVLKDVRLAAGSVAPVPLRLLKTEDKIRNKKLTPGLIQELKYQIKDEIAPISDVRASLNYRQEVTESLFEEIFSEFLIRRSKK